MSKCLLRGQYYRSQDLQSLFSRLGIKAEEVISQEFDDILKLVEQRFRKLSRKYHPDKNKGNEKQAEEKFKKLGADKKELKEYLNALKEGKSPNQDRESSAEEALEKQRKIDEILSRKSKVLNRVILYFSLVRIILAPSIKVEFCLSQLRMFNKLCQTEKIIL